MCFLVLGQSGKSIVPKRAGHSGFTLIELVVVILILSILAVFTASRFSDLTRSARIATLEGVEGSMRSTIGIIRSTAYIKGLSIAGSNPPSQAGYIVETEAGTSEVDWRNLCPESRAELGDALTMSDHIGLSESGDLTEVVDNRYTRVGYDIRGSGPPTTNGCYVTYDSFGDPDCTVDIVITDC